MSATQAARGAPTKRTWVGVLVVTILVTVPAWLLGPVIWPPVGEAPTPAQAPFFMVASFFEALSLGLGVSFLIFGFPIVRKMEPGLRLRAWLLYLGIGWFLVSWWSHGNLHASNGDNMQRLLYIEYGYHVTLVVAAAIAGYCFLSLVRQWIRSHPPTT